MFAFYSAMASLASYNLFLSGVVEAAVLYSSAFFYADESAATFFAFKVWY